MGWLNFLFGKKGEIKTETVVTRNLNVNEVETLLKNELDKIWEPFKEKVEKNHSSILNTLDVFQASLKNLEKAQVTEPVDPQLLQKAVSHRNNLVNKMNTMFREFRKPLDLDFDSVLDFHNSCISAFDYANKKSSQDIEIVNTVFKKEMSEVAQNFKELNDILKAFGGNIDEKKNSIFSVKESLGFLERFNYNIELLNQKKNELENENKNLIELDIEKKSIEQNLEKLLSNGQWTKFNEYNNEKGNIENEIEQVKSSIIQIISPSERAMKKFKNLVYHGKESFEFKKELNYYVSYPFDAFVSDKGKILKLILDKIQNAIIENKIDLKDQTEEKTLEHIRGVLDSSVLEELAARYDELKSKLDFVENKISHIEVLKQKSMLEEELEKSKMKIDEKNRAINTLNEKIKQMQKTIEENKLELENKVDKIINQKVSLLLER